MTSKSKPITSAPEVSEEKPKYKLFDIVNSQAALSNLYTQALPIRVTYILHKFIKQVDAELQEFATFRNQLLEKYGKKESDTKYTVGPDEAKLFEAEMTELLNTELTIDVPHFTFEDLADAKLSVQDLDTLGYLISD